MEDPPSGSEAPQQSKEESIASSTNILSSSENTNNENREKELLTQGDGGSAGGSGDADGLEEVVAATTVMAENVETDLKTENPWSDEYAKNVSYNEQGEAIYTDPKTNHQFKWSEETSSWESVSTPAASGGSNPYENEHYRWCKETSQWIPKVQTSTSSAPGEAKLENEHYRWDKDTNQWVPKVQGADVTYDFGDGVHTYTDRDGAVYFWDVEKKAWFPKIDDDFMARYQLSYGFIDNTGSSEGPKPADEDPSDETAAEDRSTSPNPSTEPPSGTGSKPLKRKAPQEPPKWFDIPPEQNTKVYVSNLPLDITEEEFIQVMSKCGLIMRDPQTQKHKVKLYAEPDGQLKGDGLCDYIKVESVDLALNLLDGSDVRGNKIKVQQAKFQMRGEYNPALKPKKKKKDKEKLQKMKEKLFDWRPEKMRGERSKHERVVIIKNLFTPDLFDREVHLIIDYQNDLREECAKCGTVRKVVLYDRHPEGVAQITMADPDEADVVVQMMNGRYFGKRKLTAEIWDGKTKFKIAETEAEIKTRLSNWDKFLVTDEAAQQDEKLNPDPNPEEASAVPESDDGKDSQAEESA